MVDLEQHGFELCRPTYRQLFSVMNTTYYMIHSWLNLWMQDFGYRGTTYTEGQLQVLCEFLTMQRVGALHPCVKDQLNTPEEGLESQIKNTGWVNIPGSSIFRKAQLESQASSCLLEAELTLGFLV